jgi:hypothetical protein
MGNDRYKGVDGFFRETGKEGISGHVRKDTAGNVILNKCLKLF